MACLISSAPLSLFRQVAHSNLRDVPPDYLNVVAEDAEKTLAQFREILSFTGEGVENPKEASAAMISAVRDAYQPIYEKLLAHHHAPGERAGSRAQAERRFALAIGRGDRGASPRQLSAPTMRESFYPPIHRCCRQSAERAALKLPALRGRLLLRRQTRSIIDAIPCPTPMHIVHSA